MALWPETEREPSRACWTSRRTPRRSRSPLSGIPLPQSPSALQKNLDRVESRSVRGKELIRLGFHVPGLKVAVIDGRGDIELYMAGESLAIQDDLAVLPNIEPQITPLSMANPVTNPCGRSTCAPKGRRGRGRRYGGA